MAELFLLVAIVVLVVFLIRGGKPVVDDPVVVSRPGKYHITLAPQLGHAQDFIEAIVQRLGDVAQSLPDCATQCFAVHDEKVSPPGKNLYLLAVALRGGMLYFQAINPLPLLRDSDSHFKTVSGFSAAVLKGQPCASGSDVQSSHLLHDAVQNVAAAMQLRLDVLTA